MDDLEQNHGRCCLKASLQDLATHVGTVVQAKEEKWNYATPELAGKVTTVGIGVDGTCMLICDQKWREAMTGSLSLADWSLVCDRRGCQGCLHQSKPCLIVTALRFVLHVPYGTGRRP